VALLGDGGGEECAENCGVGISFGEIVGEQSADIEDPCCGWYVLPRELRPDAVIGIQDGEDLKH
jgi:hypothetical protein